MNYLFFLGALLLYFVLTHEENKKHKKAAILILGSIGIVALLYNFGYLIGEQIYHLEQAVNN